MACPTLEVVYGNMVDYDTILKCVTGADYVLHIGAMVSPMADNFPKETLYTNIGSTLNIIKAIKEQPNKDDIHVAYIGTIAMTGHREEPIQFGRVGDPMNPSIFDYYAMSKIFSEMALYESGLKHWVSIRQTGQHPSNESAGDEPIIFHQHPNVVLEWSTSIESGICMANLCEDWVDESFWRKAYNLSSGKGFRLASWELVSLMFEPMGLRYEDVFDPRELALYNFHGQYYTDSDLLEEQLHFRCIDANEYWSGVADEVRAMVENPMIRSMMPTAEMMRAKNAQIGHKRMGFHWMFENKEEDWIRAFFGSRERQAAIKSYEEGYKLYHLSEENPTYLCHGYDEEKGLENLILSDLQEAAKFRGGECLASKIPDIYSPIKWRCASGHEFMMSVNAALQGGHWCPECLRYEWSYGNTAKVNPFYAQVWTPIHGDNDNYVIPMEHSAYDIYQELKEKLGL